MQERHGQDKQLPCDIDDENAEEDKFRQRRHTMLQRNNILRNQDVCSEGSTPSHRSTHSQLSLITSKLELMGDNMMFAEIIHA